MSRRTEAQWASARDALVTALTVAIYAAVLTGWALAVTGSR